MFNKALTVGISLLDAFVIAAIDFDNEPFFDAREINDESTNRVLSPEF